MLEYCDITAASFTRTSGKAEVSKVPNSVIFATIVLILFGLWTNHARYDCTASKLLAIERGKRVMGIEVIVPSVSLCLAIIVRLLHSFGDMRV